MSVITITIWVTLGLLIGAGLVFAFAGNGVVRETLLRQILRSNRHGWTITQRGTRYTLDPVERDEDANCYRVKADDGEEFAEDGSGMMHTLMGVPFGLRKEENRNIIDVETAEAAHMADEKITDGGKLATTDGEEPRWSLSDIKDYLIVGRTEGERRELVYINPYYAVREAADIVDLRNTSKLMRHDADPDTPRKAAKNAVEAERAFENWGDLKTWVKNISYFMLGAIATYIGTTSGGGGGGGGGAGSSVDVGLTLVPAVADVLPMVM